MRFRFIEDRRDDYPVRQMCTILGVSPAGYYAWRARPESRRVAANRILLSEIVRVHRDSGGRYGSPRVHAVLRAQGRGVSRGRIERLMRRYGIRAIMMQPAAGANDRQPSQSADRPQPSRSQLHGSGAKPHLARRHHLHSNRRGLAVPGRGSWTSSAARSSVGPCATICEPNCRSRLS